MAYAIICFATLFSFVGTVLGGIWADQSWGRFWGWTLRKRGPAHCPVVRNHLARALGWHGARSGPDEPGDLWQRRNRLFLVWCQYAGHWVALLRFMDAAFKWLMLFTLSQFFLIGLGLLPLQYWRSFRTSLSSASGVAGAAPKVAPEPAA